MSQVMAAAILPKSEDAHKELCYTKHVSKAATAWLQGWDHIKEKK